MQKKKLGVTLLRFRGYSVWKATLILKLNLAHVGQYAWSTGVYS